jgi:hypothetical protein
MTSSRRTLLLPLLAALFLAAATIVRPAIAGTLHVRDAAHVLSPDAVAQLRSVVASAPFDGRLVFTSEFSGAEELDRYTSSITEPAMVVVAVDPLHHQVRVHFGTRSRIAQSSYGAIERAGNDAFRHADWEGGAAAIFRAAAKSVGVEEGAPVGGTPPVASGSSFFSPGLFLVLVVGAVAVAIYFARRRAAYDAPYGPIAPSPGYGPGPFTGPGYTAGPTQGGLGPVGGGLIGAGLGGLAGYELGKLEGEREERGRDRAADVMDTGDDRGGGNADAGGGGSSWDDDDGGGFDGGGGGGFDGDGGGGGSDFGA